MFKFISKLFKKEPQSQLTESQGQLIAQALTIGEDVNTAPIHYEIGLKAYYQEQMYSFAIRELQIAVNGFKKCLLSPYEEMGCAQYIIGKSYVAIGDMPQALESFKESLETYQKLEEQQNLCQTKLKIDVPLNTLIAAVYSEISKIYGIVDIPQDKVPYEWFIGIEYGKRALEYDPGNPDYCINLALLYLLACDFNGADNMVDQAIELNPSNESEYTGMREMVEAKRNLILVSDDKTIS